MDSEKSKVVSDDKLINCNRNYEEEREKELITLIAKIIVDKVLKQDGEKRDTIS